MEDCIMMIHDRSKRLTNEIIKEHEELVNLYKNKDQIIDDYYFENLKHSCTNIVTQINNMEYLDNKLYRIANYKEVK